MQYRREDFHEWLLHEVHPKLKAIRESIGNDPMLLAQVANHGIHPFKYWLDARFEAAKGPLPGHEGTSTIGPTPGGPEAGPTPIQGVTDLIKNWDLESRGDGTIGLPQERLGPDQFRNLASAMEAAGFEYVRAVPGKAKAHFRKRD